MKYVVEFENEPHMREEGLNYYKCKQVPWWSASTRIIDNLTPYDEAFAGYQESAYQKGLEDAWEAVQKIERLLFNEPQWSKFADGHSFYEVITTWTPEEAIDKLKAYDEEQDSINVGDEVENTETLQKGVVYEVVPDQVNGFYLTGRQVHFCWLKSDVRKTGRHFDEVEKLLERMREG